MGSCWMKIKRLTDYAIAMSIIMDTDLEDKIYEDGSNQLIPDLVQEIWGLAVDENEFPIGCYRFHPMGMTNFQVHAFILPEYRKEYAIPASIAVLEWFFSLTDNVMAVTAIIPDSYPNVIAHAECAGLRKCGIIPKSYTHKGELRDQIIMVIHREGVQCQAP